jgi:hypothetical protein
MAVSEVSEDILFLLSVLEFFEDNIIVWLFKVGLLLDSV